MKRATFVLVFNASKGGMLKATFISKKINLDSIGKANEARKKSGKK